MKNRDNCVQHTIDLGQNKSSDFPLSEEWQDVVYKCNGILEYKRKFRNSREHRLLIFKVLELFIVNHVRTLQ